MSNQKLDWEIHFSLSEKIDCESNIQTRQDIEFDIETGKSNQKSIKGFTIKVNNASEDEAKQKAQTRAQILTDILVLTSGTSSEPRMDGTSVKKPNGGHTVSKTLTISYAIRNNADLSMSDEILTDLLESTDPDLNQRMRYVNKAMNALKSKDAASSIRDLYLACNQNPQGNIAKYKSLRNALSHDPVFVSDILNIKRDFGSDYFDFTQQNKFDYSSEKNKKHLVIEANSFMNQVRQDVKKDIF